jgi:hypothetical protein
MHRAYPATVAGPRRFLPDFPIIPLHRPGAPRTPIQLSLLYSSCRRGFLSLGAARDELVPCDTFLPTPQGHRVLPGENMITRDTRNPGGAQELRATSENEPRPC